MKARKAAGTAAGTSAAEADAHIMHVLELPIAPSPAGCLIDFADLGYPQSTIRSIARTCELALKWRS